MTLVTIALALFPGRPLSVLPELAMSTPTSTRGRTMMVAPPDRIRRLEAAVVELQLLEVSEGVITVLKEELLELKESADLVTMDQSETSTTLDKREPALDNARIVAEIREAKGAGDKDQCKDQ